MATDSTSMGAMNEAGKESASQETSQNGTDLKVRLTSDPSPCAADERRRRRRAFRERGTDGDLAGAGERGVEEWR